MEYRKLNRMKASMAHAAQNGLLYHLWWHPHNFGQHTDRNMKTLRSILEHYRKMNAQYGFESLTMEECAHRLDAMGAK